MIAYQCGRKSGIKYEKNVKNTKNNNDYDSIIVFGFNTGFIHLHHGFL